MNESDRPGFARLLNDALAFYGKDVSAFAMRVWWQACERFSMEQVTQAMTAHALDPDRGQFAPKPADLIRVLHGTSADRSLIAWGKVIDAAQRAGAYESVVFDDGAIHSAISDMGGWPAVCRSKADELQFVQKRFCELHRAYSGRPNAPYPASLPGLHELANGFNGRPVAPPLAVGDVSKARAVLENGATGSKTALTAINALPDIRRLESK